MNPDLVTRCFGLECRRRSACARHVALLIKAMPHTLAGINVCEAMGGDRSIPLRLADDGTTRPAAVCADPSRSVCAATNTTGAA